jgi:hypothetical protein
MNTLAEMRNIEHTHDQKDNGQNSEAHELNRLAAP